MIIEVTFKDEEREKYIAETTSNNILLASIVNAMPMSFDAMNEDETKNGTVFMEIKDNEGQFVPVADKAILYKLYQLINTQTADIKDISIFNSISKNLIYSTEVFGYEVSSAGIGDFYLDETVLTEEEENQKGNYPHIFLQIVLTIKEE